jgi:hypothetical protein
MGAGVPTSKMQVFFIVMATIVLALGMIFHEK